MDLHDDIIERAWNSGKRKDETIENQEFIHHEQTPKEGIYHLDETRIRIMLCVSFTNLNWWQATDLACHLLFLRD